MMQSENPIVIVAHEDRQHWLNDLLKSLEGYEDNPVVVYTNTKEANGYELAAIRWAYEQRFEEFLLLHDSVVVKDHEGLRKVFAHPGSVFLCPQGLSYLGKYQKKVLSKVRIPLVTKQRDAITEETAPGHFMHQYFAAAQPVKILDPTFKDGKTFEFRHGRQNMKIENQWFIKYKGTWSPSMVKD